jgi:hypothetical protein
MTAPSTPPDTPALAAFGRLRHAERLLLRACGSGDIVKVGLRRPEERLGELCIRASFLAFVLRGGVPLRGRRLHLMGAYIEGRLDLGDAAVAASLWFYRCTFDSPVLLDGSRIGGTVTFAGCQLAALFAERSVIDGDLVLNAGCTVENDLRLTQARIGGDLDCARLDLSGGSSPAQPRRALLADALQVGGCIRLGDGFQSVGEVRFVGARVRGDFHASGRFNGNALPEGGRGAALLLDRVAVEGSVRFDAGFGAAGRVALRRACIGGDFDATGANFDWLGDASWDEGGSLVMDRARVDGALVLRELQAPLLGASFVGARVGTLCDDISTWGERLALDGFAYSRLGDGAPLDTVFRTGWLERQDPAHLRSQFRVQPWRRLIRVLRRMGHEHHAGSIGLRRERWLRAAGRVGAWAPPALRWLPRAGHFIFGLLAGHGYRPARLLGWLVAVWLVCGALYGWVVDVGTTADVASSAQESFSPLGYSLDRLLPWADLGEVRTAAVAAPWAHPMRWLSHFEAAFGWLAAALLVASLAGWADRDRRP